MTGRLGILIVMLITVVICALYFVLGRNQLTKHIEELREENNQLRSELAQIMHMEQEIPKLQEQVPFWFTQMQFLRRAVPERINDDAFLANLATELDKRNVDLVGIIVGRGGSWLGNLTDEQEQALVDAGLDVAAAKQIKYAIYSASLLGEYSDVLMAFESLKGYGRMYSVDSVISPSGARGGAVVQNVSTTLVPIDVTGRIYYGVDGKHLSLEGLEEVFYRSAMRPVVDGLQSGLGDTAKDLVTDGAPAPDGANPAGDGTAENNTTDEDNTPAAGLQGLLSPALSPAGGGGGCRG